MWIGSAEAEGSPHRITDRSRTERKPMLRMLALLIAPSLLLFAPGPGTAQTEIPGSVTSVSGDTVTIQVPGTILPRAGDEVRLRFRDPVPGAGLVFLEGSWRVDAVRREEVDAVPAGDVAQPQEGLVAVILSEHPQSKADFTPAVAPRTEPDVQRAEEPAVAAEVRRRDDSDVERIDRRRWFTISAGAGAVGVQSPTFYDYEPDGEIRPRLAASAGLMLLPNLALSGYLGAVSVDGTDPDGNTQSAQEIYKGLGATLYFGTPGNVPGDVYPFIQGGLVWYDVHYGGADSEPEVTGTGFFGGAGVIFTIRRGMGLYLAGQYFGSSYDESHTVFDRVPAEVSAGATIVF